MTLTIAASASSGSFSMSKEEMGSSADPHLLLPSGHTSSSSKTNGSVTTIGFDSSAAMYAASSQA
jgi:hypothetical protein